MGNYMQAPATAKNSEDRTCEKFSFGSSAMQGWRISQEDAHCCLPDFDKERQTALFGVFDGHGGHEVSWYVANKLPELLLSTSEYVNGNLEEALKQVFLSLDANLIEEEVLKILKEKADENQAASGDEEDEENEAEDLVKEAAVPVSELIKKYKKEIRETLAAENSVSNEEELNDLLMEAAVPLSNMINNKFGKGTKEENATANGHSKEDEKPAAASPSGDASEDSKVVKSEANGKVEGSSSTPSNSQYESATENNAEQKPSSDTPKDEPEAAKQEESPAKAAVSTSDCSSAEPSGSGNAPEPTSSGPSTAGPGASEASGSGASEEAGPGPSSSGAGPSGSGTSSMALTSAVNEEELDDSEDFDSDDDDDDDDDDSESDSEEDVDIPFACGAEDAMEEVPGYGSGTTACVALLRGQQLLVANAGDSRCVLSKAGVAVDMSEDHKPEDDEEKTRIEKAGGTITLDGRVNGGLNLSRALGDHLYKQSEGLSLGEQMISSMPEVRSVDLTEEHDFLVVACDGIWNSMDSQAVVDFVKERIQKDMKLSEICEEMFTLCLANDTEGDGTGCDNMTCVIVKFCPALFNSSKRKLSEGSEPESAEKRSKAEAE